MLCIYILYITSLPAARLHRVVEKRHINYDDAHQTATDCATEFSLCPDSIWKAGFLIEYDATLMDNNNFPQFLKTNK